MMSVRGDRNQAYLKSLNKDARDRYIEKLSCINGLDPYSLLKEEWSKEVLLFPAVSYPDIVNYLIFTPSCYTADDLKAYKGLEAYNQFVSGWVRDVSTVIINGKHVVTAKVLHSQRPKEPPLQPWIIVERDGTVVCSHCKCMAGLGETCTHVAATLFAIEATVRIRDSKTVTDKKAYWLLPTGLGNITCSQLSDIDFTSAKTKKQMLDNNIDSLSVDTAIPCQSKKKSIPIPTPDEVAYFLKSLSACETKPAILSVMSPYSDSYIPMPLASNYPIVLTNLLQKSLIGASHDALISKCQTIKISFSDEEATNVEQNTRGQSKSKLWYNFRAGRITASHMKNVCRTDPSNPSISLIKAICYPCEQKFSTSAMRYGCQHESSAKEKYAKLMNVSHFNFSLVDNGLILNPEYPHLGATPDGLIKCDCCGEGCLEVKCPFCAKDLSVNDYLKCSASCLQESHYGSISLKTNHQYYYQVQTQLIVTGRDFADFVVLTGQEMHIERIERDEGILTDISMKSKVFFEHCLLPELVGKFYSKPPEVCEEDAASAIVTETENNEPMEDVWCFCKRTESGDMIACDGPSCKIGWFHFECVNIKYAPKGKWFCHDCKSLTRRK